MVQVFISSIQEGYSDVRQAVRRAVESLDMRPLMAEIAGAHPESPQRALLDLVARCDVFILLVGSRYSTPTEDEFNEAKRLGRPILVLRQNGDLDAEQAAFLERVAGGWSGGRFWGTFDGDADVGFAAVRALTNSAGGRQNLAPTAQARAEQLAGDRKGGRSGYRSVARVAFAPLVAGPILDAVVLDRPDIGDAVCDVARRRRLVPQSVGLVGAVTRDGIAVRPAGQQVNPPVAFVGADGAVVCEFDISSEDQFGSMRVDPDQLRSGIVAAAQFALDIWEAFDAREDVQQVAVALVVPDAQNKVFGAPTKGNSISMGWGLPQIVAVPSPPVVVRRAAVTGDELATRLVAEVKRIFADSNALSQ